MATNPYDKYLSQPNPYDKYVGGKAPAERGDFSRGWGEAWDQLPQLGYGLLAGAGAAAEKVVGEGGIATGIKKAGVAGYTESSEKIAAGSKESDSWSHSYDQAKAGDFGSLVDWLQHGLGYVTGQGVQMLATAGIGAVGGKMVLGTAAKQIASGMVAKETAALTAANAGGKLTAEQIAAQATANVASKIGQTSAIGASALGMEGGEIFGDLTQQAEKDGRQLTGAELGKAFAATLAAGGLEFVGDKIGLDILLGKSRLLKPAEHLGAGGGMLANVGGRLARGAVAATGAAPIEGATEYAQTLIEEYGKGNDAFSQESLAQAKDAAALGALGGTVIGGVGGGIRGAKQKADPVSEVLVAPSVDDAIKAATLAIAGPVKKSEWEVVDGVLALPGPAREAKPMGMLTALPAPDGQPVYMADAAGNVALQPAEARTEALNRDFEARQQRDAAALAERTRRDELGKQTPRGEAPAEPIPVGDATRVDMIPTGEATDWEYIPTGQATELSPEVIQADDLLSKDGEPYGNKTSAQARAFASGGGNVVAIPDHFGSGKPGYVVRPLVQGQPNNTRGTNAADLGRTAGQRPADDGRGAGVGGVRDERPGDVLASPASVAGQGVAGAGAAGNGAAPTSALTPGATVTLQGRDWQVKDAKPSAVILTRQKEDGGTESRVIKAGTDNWNAIQVGVAATARAATHKDPGEPAEAVTPAVVREAIKTAAESEGRSRGAMKADALRLIDAAIAKAASDKTDDGSIVIQDPITYRGKKEITAVRKFAGDDDSITVKAREGADGKWEVTDDSYDGSGTGRKKNTRLGGLVGTPAIAKRQLHDLLMKLQSDGTVTESSFVEIRVPGDGVFKVRNTREALAEFRAKVEASPGFKDRKPQAGPSERMTDALDRRGTDAAISNMLDEGDFQAALDYAQAKGVDMANVKLTKVLRDRLDKWEQDQASAKRMAEYEAANPPAPKPEPAPAPAAEPEPDDIPEAGIASQTFEQWAKAQYAGNEYKAKYLEEFGGDEFLTRAGMENAAAVEVQRPVLSEDKAGFAAMATQQFELARAFDDWLNTLPEEQQDNRGVVVRKMGETPVGEWARVEDDIGNGVALRYYEKNALQFRIGFGARNWPELRAYVRELASRFDQSREADENALYTLMQEAGRAANAAEPGSLVPAGWVYAAGRRFTGSVDAEVAQLNAAKDGNEYREFRGGIIQRPAERSSSAVQAEPAGPVAADADLWKRITAGEATPDEFKAGFEAWVSNKAAILADLSTKTKADLLKIGGAWFASRYKNDTKPEVVEALWRDGASAYTLGRSFQYGMGKDSYINGIRRMVKATGADELAQFVADRKTAQDEALARVAKIAEAIKDPKTLADYNTWMRATMEGGKTFKEARFMLTPEQRAAYDDLAAESSRASRKVKQDTERTTVRAAGQTTAGEIIATKHTRDGHDLWVVKLSDRVSKDDYVTLLAGAKRLGGNYSSFRGNGAVPGFQFRTPDAAQAFLKLAGGDTAQATEVAQERRNAFEDDRSQSAAERLTEMADRLEERADESMGRDRLANTDRRARFAASAEAAANADKAMAKTMRNIASAIMGGGAKFLDRVRQKVQVELLQGYIRSAQDAQLRAKYESYADQEKHKGAAPTFETADYAEFPTFTAYRSDLASLGRQLVEVDGTKKLGERIMKVADDVSDAFTAFVKEPGNFAKVATFRVRDTPGGIVGYSTKDAAERALARSGLKGKGIAYQVKRGQYTLILSPSEATARGIWKGDGDKRITLDPDFAAELVEKIGRASRRGAKVSVPWQFETAYDRRKQLARMGIESPAEFRAALREFIAMREQPAEADKIKAMERAMVGRRNDGLDFFPTPEGTADEMVAAADIQPGMRVLEPSAGMGHIAERIRAAGTDPDVIEFSNERRELLQAKGFNVQASDFMEFTDANHETRGFTYGDVFRAPDGALGVMRSNNGLGGDRVGIDPLDESGNPDHRRMQWHTYGDLEPVEKRGIGSGYDRILMNPPFSDGRDIQHVRHAYDLLKPGGRLVAIMGESAFFNQNKRATEFREWLESVGGTDEKLPEGTFNDPSLPVSTGANARMVVIEKPTGASNESRSVRGNDAGYVGRGVREDAGGVQGERTQGPSGEGGEGAQFSRNAATRTGIPLDDAKAVAASIREALPTAPQIVLHESIDKAPEPLRKAIIKAGAANDVEAAYHDGAIHVFPQHIASVERMAFVVGHHEIRHHGLRSMLGPRLGPVLLAMHQGNANLRELAKAKMDDGLADSRIEAIEEALADMSVEEITKLNGWDKIVTAIRQWLRNVAAKLRRTMPNLADAIDPQSWTDRDIAAMVLRAENVSRGGYGPFATSGTVFNRDENPTWYSALGKQVEGASMNAGQAGAWKALLKNWISTGKVKADEVEWSGLNEFLDMTPGKITKAQVADYLGANGVQVQETVLGAGQEAAAYRVVRDGDGWNVEDPNGQLKLYPEPFETEDAAQEEADSLQAQDSASVSSETKYGQYQLPGGTNYREVLLTLPGDATAARLKTVRQRLGMGREDGVTDDEYRALTEEEKKLLAEGPSKDYRSGHWDQPNIVAHLRVNDRVDAGGQKILFVEEVQGDWPQAMRKQKDAIGKAVDSDFTGIIERMKKAGVLEVECD